MHQLSGLDASFLYGETPTTPMHVGGLQIYDPSTAPTGEVTFERILAYVQSHLHLVRTFREKLLEVPMNLHHPYWVDDGDFDLEFHVRELAGSTTSRACPTARSAW
jgi:diacylglycerol O-acyltransferase